MMYYTSQSQFTQRFQQTARQNPVCPKNAEVIRDWQEQARHQLRKMLGLDTFELVAPDPECLNRQEFADYVREKWVVSTESRIHMPFYILKPAHPVSSNPPIILAVHGHGTGKEVVAGNRDDAERAHFLKEHPGEAFGEALAKAGFQVVCPDVRGFGERRESGRQGEDQWRCSSCDLLNHMGLPLGQPALGMFLWDLMRLTDYILHAAQTDTIGVAGMSGGGMQSLFLAALDPRVRATAVSGYFYGYRQALLERPQNCSCNFVPGLWQAFDMGDIGALVAPRALLIESGDQDPLSGADGLNNVYPQVETARRAFETLDASKNLLHAVFHGAHMWHGAQTPAFFKQHLV